MCDNLEELEHCQFFGLVCKQKWKYIFKSLCAQYLYSMEKNIAQVQYGWQHSEYAALVFRTEVENVHGTL